MHSNLAQASQLARKLWDREYQELKIIPSTTRRSPSKAVLLYAEILDYSRFRTVLDCGCGNGRNAIYLASKGCNVHCIDFAPAALEILRQRVEGTELQDRIKIYERSLLERFPFPNDHFDFVLDSYTFCHFLGDERLPYLREISRVVRTSGLFMLSLFPPADGYYGTMLSGSRDDASVITDPSNGIKKRLYSEMEIEELLAPRFKVTLSSTLRFDDIVEQRIYTRRILTTVSARVTVQLDRRE